ncbi:MAG: hypothetical protein ACKPKO_57565, partial [Candidatus Fonsibacter sp.]
SVCTVDHLQRQMGTGKSIVLYSLVSSMMLLKPYCMHTSSFRHNEAHLFCKVSNQKQVFSTKLTRIIFYRPDLI